MTQLTIRYFLPQDAQGVAQIYRNNLHWFEDISVTTEFILGNSMRPDFQFFVAEVDGEIIGFSGSLYYGPVGRAEFGPICVDEKYQKKGVGTKLLHIAIDDLRKKQVFRLVAMVKLTNKKAISFFNSVGFKREAELVRYTRKGEQVMQMVRFI